MSEKWCSKCGAELPADSVELCRKCVLLLALDTDDDATPALAGVVDHAVSALGVVLVQRKSGFRGRSLEEFWRRSWWSFGRWRGSGKFEGIAGRIKGIH